MINSDPMYLSSAPVFPGYHFMAERQTMEVLLTATQATTSTSTSDDYDEDDEDPVGRQTLSGRKAVTGVRQSGH